MSLRIFFLIEANCHLGYMTRHQTGCKHEELKHPVSLNTPLGTSFPKFPKSDRQLQGAKSFSPVSQAPRESGGREPHASVQVQRWPCLFRTKGPRSRVKNHHGISKYQNVQMKGKICGRPFSRLLHSTASVELLRTVSVAHGGSWPY